MNNIHIKETGSAWTPWTEILDDSGAVTGFYRTNHKKVQVRNCIFNSAENGRPYKTYRAEASCSPDDKFSLFFGVQLAYARMKLKAFCDDFDYKIGQVNDCVAKIEAQQKIINKLISESQYIK